MTQTAEENHRRARVTLAARCSTELEGARSTDATRADQDDYVRGGISAAELLARVQRRYVR